MELEVLSSLKFQIMTTSPFKLLTGLRLNNKSLECMAQFIIEACLLGLQFNEYSVLERCNTAIMLAAALLDSTADDSRVSQE